ncbi:hypothetical protein OG884_36805 [Streptosporangium sp. NBC_01755]|uniref:hypothetical protein n=1 Tax=unclassified Streptosporangium TaxID=2632669 RepID=UPI002DD90E8D|nr:MULTISPECIES: hypothetical protein [unclassified Streptosporangium]WSA28259.1 hypothetical protein OIE13_10530 [Streptosporangium sp. NBC_01810]WSD00264.1 hypothetical protein OG884_36805 [Streptosporangium sp. NBC_01755]
MPNIGPMELLVVAVLFAVILVIVIGVVMAARKGSRVPMPMPIPMATPQGLHELVTELTRRGRKIEAIKELRHHTGLSLRESKMIVDDVAMGHDLWSQPAMARFKPSQPTALPHAGAAVPDLATRVRELKAAGRAEQAVYLVRGETGMGEREAELFVEAL